MKTDQNTDQPHVFPYRSLVPALGAVKTKVPLVGNQLTWLTANHSSDLLVFFTSLCKGFFTLIENGRRLGRNGPNE